MALHSEKALAFIPTLLASPYLLHPDAVLPGDPVLGMAGERANPETLARIRPNRPGQTAAGPVSRVSEAPWQPESSAAPITRPEDQRRSAPEISDTASLRLRQCSLLRHWHRPWCSRLRKRGQLGPDLTLLVRGRISIRSSARPCAHALFAFYLRWLRRRHGQWQPAQHHPAGGHVGTFSLPTLCASRGQPCSSALPALCCRGPGKGLSESSVVFKHALKNALIPVVTLIGLDLVRIERARC